MTGAWLVSYLILWVLVIAIALRLVGALRQIGMLHQRAAPIPAPEDTFPDLDHDGPDIGSPIPDELYDTVNDFGTVTPIALGDKSTLILFMSPMCEACQDDVEPLNALAGEPRGEVHPMVIMRGDEQSCRAFLSIFPLHLPVVCDAERNITMGFDVHRTPFGLLYDSHGRLVRKGVIEGSEDLRALLGDPSASTRAQAKVFPQLSLPLT